MSYSRSVRLLIVLGAGCGSRDREAATECDAALAGFQRPVVWYEDADGDGVGGESTTTSCEPPDGWVSASGDCDDADPAATVEWQQYIDTDRDGLGDVANPRWWCGSHSSAVDNADDCDDRDPHVGGPSTWYADADGDGYSGASASIEACTQPVGFTATSTDCDDADRSVYPGGPPICGDGIDNDCDPDVEPESGCRFEGEHLLSSTRGRWYGERYGDGLGFAVGAADVDGDGIAELMMTAPGLGDGSDGYPTGRVAVLRAGAGPALVDGAAMATFGARTPRAQLGIEAAPVGDLDGNGTTDIIVAGSYGAWLLTSITPGHHLVEDEAIAWFDFQTGAGAYSSIQDVDDDGRSDLAILSESADFIGSVLVYSGPLSGDYAIDDAWSRIVDRSPPDAIGYAVEDLGDMDADGRVDLGITDVPDGRFSAGGVVYVVTELSGGTHLASEIAHAAFYGSYPGEAAGLTLASAGDTDGDGYADMLIGAACRNGASGESSAVAASLVLGPVGGGEYDLAADAHARWSSTDLGVAGEAIAAGGDLDGDGHHDVAISRSMVPNSGGYLSSGAFLYYGPMLGGLDVEADSDARFFDESWSFAGDSMEFVPDVDDDGRDELLIGAPEWGTWPDYNRGAVFLVLGGEVF